MSAMETGRERYMWVEHHAEGERMLAYGAAVASAKAGGVVPLTEQLPPP